MADTSNQLCSRCRRQDATVYCACQGPNVYLCGTCILAHLQELPDPMHSIKNYRAAGVKLAEFQKKEDTEYRKAIADIDSLPQSIQTLIQPLVTEWKGKVAEHHGALGQLVQECETSDTNIGYFKGQALYQVSLNTSSLDEFNAAVKKLVTLNLHFPGKNLPNYFPVLRGGRLEKVALDDQMRVTSIRLSAHTTIDADSVYCLMPDERVFVCGGKWHAKVYLIESTDGTVHNLPDMNDARAWHGLVNYAGEMLVFGGAVAANSVTGKCECFSFVSGSWTGFGPMNNSRAGINPCEMRGCIYIAGGSCTTVERYTPRNQVFELLNLTLPGNKWSMCLRSGDFLYICSSSKVTKYEIQGNSGREIESLTGVFQSYYSVLTPLVSDEKAYFFHPYQQAKEIISITFSPLGQKKLGSLDF